MNLAKPCTDRRRCAAQRVNTNDRTRLRSVVITPIKRPNIAKAPSDAASANFEIDLKRISEPGMEATQRQ